jgi:hypothetical protein
MTADHHKRRYRAARAVHAQFFTDTPMESSLPVAISSRQSMCFLALEATQISNHASVWRQPSRQASVGRTPKRAVLHPVMILSPDCSSHPVRSPYQSCNHRPSYRLLQRISDLLKGFLKSKVFPALATQSKLPSGFVFRVWSALEAPRVECI